MTAGFSGDVAEFYAQFRRGYPERVIDFLQEYFAFGHRDSVLDLGCGTGQLTVPLASRAGTVIGMDPEPDMLRLARKSAAGRGVDNATWVLGADTDVHALGRLLLGRSCLAMTVVGQALHWMRHEDLFRELVPLFRTGGGVAVVANGAPLWLQESDWSRALRSFLERHFDTELAASCGTTDEDRIRYADALRDAGYTDVKSEVVSYSDELSFDQIIGGVCSAIPAEQLPEGAERVAFADGIRQVLPRDEQFVEEVRVGILVGRVAVVPD